MSIGYEVHTLDLTTARDDERIGIGAGYVSFTRVDGPVWVRFGSGRPKIRIASIGDAQICRQKVIDAIFVTNEVGAGQVEFIASDDLRLDFNGPASSSGADRLRVHMVPAARHATAIYSTNLGVNYDNPMKVATLGTTVVKTDQYNDQLFGWAGTQLSAVGNDQAARFALTQNPARSVVIPLHAMLSNVTIDRSAFGWWETETQLLWVVAGSAGEQVYRFGFGNAAYTAAAANSYDTTVGFGMGTNPRTGWQIGATADDELFAIITTNGDNSGVDGGGHTVHVAQSLGSGYSGVPFTAKVRVGQQGGIPVVEWYIDGLLVHRHEGALSTVFECYSGSTTPVEPEPFLLVARSGAASTFDCRFGYGGGWYLRNYD